MVNHFIRDIEPKKRKKVQALFKSIEENSIKEAEQWEKLGQYCRKWAKRYKLIRQNQLPLEARNGRQNLTKELEKVIKDSRKE